MARPEGRIDEPHLAIAELVSRGCQGAVEDDLLDEHGCLQERIALACGLGKILVEIAEKALAALGVGEVVDEPPGVGVDLLPEGQQLHGAVAGDAQAEHRVVALVE
ncbi:MAG: hypothetical protein ACREVK_14015 [Gammaproteobacteria bacterium]